MSEKIYIESNKEEIILVASSEWFRQRKQSSLYAGEYGEKMDFGGEHEEDCAGEDYCDCGEREYLAYTYWDGGNYQSIILDEDDSEYTSIQDTQRLEKLEEILEKAKFEFEQTGYKFYRFGRARVSYSSWRTDWEMCSIDENFYGDAE